MRAQPFNVPSRLRFNGHFVQGRDFIHDHNLFIYNILLLLLLLLLSLLFHSFYVSFKLNVTKKKQKKKLWPEYQCFRMAELTSNDTLIVSVFMFNLQQFLLH